MKGYLVRSQAHGPYRFLNLLPPHTSQWRTCPFAHTGERSYLNACGSKTSRDAHPPIIINSKGQVKRRNLYPLRSFVAVSVATVFAFILMPSCLNDRFREHRRDYEGLGLHALKLSSNSFQSFLTFLSYRVLVCARKPTRSKILRLSGRLGAIWWIQSR